MKKTETLDITKNPPSKKQKLQIQKIQQVKKQKNRSAIINGKLVKEQKSVKSTPKKRKLDIYNYSFLNNVCNNWSGKHACIVI